MTMARIPAHLSRNVSYLSPSFTVLQPPWLPSSNFIKLFPASGLLHLNCSLLIGTFWTTQAKVLSTFILFHSYLSFSFIAFIVTYCYIALFKIALSLCYLFLTLEGELPEELVFALLIHLQHLARCLGHSKWLIAVNWNKCEQRWEKRSHESQKDMVQELSGRPVTS